MNAEELRKKMANSAVLMIGRRAIATALSILSTAVLAREVDTSDFGQYSSAMATYFMLTAASDFGFSLVLGRRVATEEQERGAVLRSTVHIQWAWAGILASATLLFAWKTGLDNIRGQVLLTMVPAVIASGWTGIRQLFLATYQTRILMKIDMTTMLLQTAAIVAVLLTGYGVVAVAAVMCVTSILNTAWAAKIGFRQLDSGSSSTAMRRSILRDALPLGASSFIMTLYVSIDLVLLGMLVENEQLGWYAAGVKVMSILVTVPNMVASAVLPGLSASVGNKAAISQLAASVWHWLIISGLVLAVGVIIFAEPLTSLLFGDQFHGAVPAVRVLALASAVALVTNVLGTLMVAQKHSKALLVQSVIALTINVAGNIALVPSKGVMAAAWLTVICECIACAGSAWTLRKTVSIVPAIEVSLRPLLAIAVCALVGLAGQGIPLLGVPVALLAFVMTMSVLKAWPSEMNAVPLSFIRRNTWAPSKP